MWLGSNRLTLCNQQLVAARAAAADPAAGGAAQAAAAAAEVGRCEQELAAEAAKRKQWAVENARRKHNFLPLAMELLKLLAKEQALGPAIDTAKAAAAAKAGSEPGGGTKRKQLPA